MNREEIKWLEYTKKECIEAGKAMAKKDIEEAKTDFLKAYMHTMANIEYLKSYAESIHEEAMTEFEDYGEKDVELYGRKISKFEAGVKYDFSSCGHPDIEKWESAMAKDKDHLDNLKKMIKTLKKKTVIVDDETGETYEVNPPIKSSTTKLKISY